MESTSETVSRVRMSDSKPKPTIPKKTRTKKTEESKETPRSKLSFKERAESMGLTKDLTDPTKDIFNYSDKFSKVSYRSLYTGYGAAIPLLAIYTSPPGKDDFKYISYVSDSYEFVGNGAIVDRIKRCIKDDGEPIVDEYPEMTPNYCQLHNEIVISSATTVPNVGDIYPQIIISNSYNGTKAVNIVFGLSVSDVATKKRWGFGFRTKIGMMKQIHVKSSETSIRTGIGNYVQGFKANILDLVQDNFARKFTEDDVFKTLELINIFRN